MVKVKKDIWKESYLAVTQANREWDEALASKDVQRIGLAMMICNMWDSKLLFIESQIRIQKIFTIDYDVNDAENVRIENHRIHVLRCLKDIQEFHGDFKKRK